MPLIRPATSSALTVAMRPSTAVAVRRTTVVARRGMAGDAHGHHYDAPNGWLFGVQPGEKAKKEGWENIFYWGFFGSMAMAAVGWAYKPDTSIQTWALEEARRRLEAEGILPPPSERK